ncbi:MAG: SDR family oxidoreductase [Candidatus Caldipriscus sp.]|nr:SDR family oxidoreductase [Candidatus Caldipriscus sp.]
MKVCVITGASSGIGYATAKLFSERGYRVYGISRRSELRADVRNYEEIKGAIERVVEKEGGLDILVVNAGIARVGYVEEFEISDWLEVINTNLNGAFYTVKAALPHIREGGHIVFVGSIASKRAFPGWAAYCASKWGLLGFAKSLGEELKGKIRVSTVLPGAVDTPLWEGIGGDRSRMLKAEDVAKVILNIVESDGWIREVEILPKGGII